MASRIEEQLNEALRILRFLQQREMERTDAMNRIQAQVKDGERTKAMMMEKLAHKKPVIRNKTVEIKPNK